MRPQIEPREAPQQVVGSVFASERLPAAAGVARIVLTGELDIATSERAGAAIRRAQAAADVLICDLKDLWFIDLAGLRVLLDAANDAEQTGRRLIVANAPPTLRRMLQVLRLERALEVPAAALPRESVHRCSEVRPHVR